MRHWIFQGNPDIFDIDTYIEKFDEIVWSVRQKHHADSMNIGDEVFIWRASGTKGLVAGIVARGKLTDKPKTMKDDAAAKGLWIKSDPDNIELRVPIKILDKCIGSKEVVKRKWLEKDPHSF